MMPVTGQSEGLVWPIDGLHLTPGGQTSTSNRVTSGPVRLCANGPGLLVILPRTRLDQALGGLGVEG
jgi:thiamine pyrophosphokinase